MLAAANTLGWVDGQTDRTKRECRVWFAVLRGFLAGTGEWTELWGASWAGVGLMWPSSGAPLP